MGCVNIAISLMAVLFPFLTFSYNTAVNAAASAAAAPTDSSSCVIENIMVQSFFAVDVFYDEKDGGLDVIRNRIIFLADVRHFLAELENRKVGVDSYNGIFAFGKEIKMLQNYTDDRTGGLRWTDIKTTVGEKTVMDALEEIIDEFKDIETPKDMDHIRLGILMTDRPLKERNDARVAAILKKIEDANIIMYAIGRKRNEQDLLEIAKFENRLFINNFTDDDEDQAIREKFKLSLCKSIEENRISLALTVGAGAIAGIVIAVIVGFIVVYFVKEYAYKNWQLRQLAEAEANMEKNKSEDNKLYKDPVTKTDLGDLGLKIPDN